MWKNFIIAGDNHGDMQDEAAVDAFHKFTKDWKAPIRIHHGDAFDCRPIRRQASEAERNEFMRPDIDAGLEFLKEYQPTHFLRGNHDERLWDQAKGRGLVAEYAGKLIEEIEDTLDDIGCKVVLPYDKRDGFLTIGKLGVIHGYTHGVNAAARSANAYGSVFMGHVHSSQVSSIPGINYRVGHSIGCLCKLNMGYSRATMATLVHNHGWAGGSINTKTGEYWSFDVNDINGLYIYPTDRKIYKGKDRS